MIHVQAGNPATRFERLKQRGEARDLQNYEDFLALENTEKDLFLLDEAGDITRAKKTSGIGRVIVNNFSIINCLLTFSGMTYNNNVSIERFQNRGCHDVQREPGRVKSPAVFSVNQYIYGTSCHEPLPAAMPL